MKSDHAHRKANSDTVTMALRLTGSTTDQKVRSRPAPSISAACMQLVRDAGHERGEDEHPNGTAMVESATIRPGSGVEHAEVEVDGVEAHRHDDAGDHLRDQQQEAERAAAARTQLGQRVAGRGGEHEGQRDGAEADEQAGAQVRQLLVEHRPVAVEGAVDREQVGRALAHVAGRG